MLVQLGHAMLPSACSSRLSGSMSATCLQDLPACLLLGLEVRDSRLELSGSAQRLRWPVCSLHTGVCGGCIKGLPLVMVAAGA